MSDVIAWQNTVPVMGHHGLGVVAEPGQLYADPAAAPEGAQLRKVIISGSASAAQGHPHVPVIPAAAAREFLAGLNGPERAAAERVIGVPA